MTRDDVVRGFFSLVLHIFFRKIHVVGHERVPREGGLVLVGNHENGLLDPLLLLVASQRPVHFLAKATLFHHPLVSPWLRLVRALPIYRRQDEGSDMTRNEATFEACEHLLLEGEALSLFPEGISHDEPRLQPLKTGTARIVGRALQRGARPVVLPAGLLYSAKSAFRSEVTVTFGVPVRYDDLSWGTGQDHGAVEALTGRMREALESLTLNAERWEDLRIVEGVRGMALDLAGVDPSAEEAGEVTRRLLAEFYRARMEHPTQVHALLIRARAYLKMLDLLRMKDGDVVRESASGSALDRVWRRLAVILVGYPPAAYGWLFNFLPYLITGRLAVLAGGGKDIVATYKIYGGILFFPLFYALQGALLGYALGPWWAVGAVLLGGPCGLWAMRYYALRAEFVRLAAVGLSLRTDRSTQARLVEMRDEVLEVLKPLVDMYR
jgi:glycerol-3-phosphate O-acyltransferase/dihydroxyacetone phosphate acyltransferase